MSEAALRVCISELRKALGDAARTPEFIATVSRRGYRFLSSVTLASLPVLASAVPSAHCSGTETASGHPKLLVGREEVWHRLHVALMQARQGVHQFVVVTGEAGMGKTAVVEAFTASLAQGPHCWLAQGHCVAHCGPSEAYLPVLDALAQLCRTPGGTRLTALLRQQAPTWFVQLPWLLEPTDRVQLQHELQGATRGRMLRELVQVLETLTTERPLVLVLEDLHWSDYATLDLLAHLARRPTPSRLFLLGTYQPMEAIGTGHPLRTVLHDLQCHGHCIEIPLIALDHTAVAAYLTARLAEPAWPAAMVPWLLQQTEGNPLFLVTLINALLDRGLLVAQAEGWRLQGSLDLKTMELPDELWPLLGQQLARVSPAAHRRLQWGLPLRSWQWPPDSRPPRAGWMCTVRTSYPRPVCGQREPRPGRVGQW